VEQKRERERKGEKRKTGGFELKKKGRRIQGLWLKSLDTTR